MPNFSGVWDLKDQVQAIAAGRWTGVPTFELYAWGQNASGQLGDNTTVSKSSPVQVGGLTNWAQVSAGTAHTAFIKTDGTLWGCGYNQGALGGRVGDNTSISRSSPVQVGTLTTWYQVSAGGNHSSAVKTDNTIWAWGFNGTGRLGDGTTVSKSSPVQIGALTNWSQVSAGGNHSAAVKTDNTVWAWGYNNRGQIGDNTVINRSSPVQVGALTTWSQVSAGDLHTAAVKIDNTLWAWGYNISGQLGDGGRVYRSSPVQIGALTNWSQVSAGGNHTAAVKTDGTLWAWGRNNYGNIGDGTIISRSSPVQIGALTTWSQVSASLSIHTAAVKTDGTLWVWGINNSGQVGDNTVVWRSSPVQVGSLTTWSQVSAGGNTTAAILQETTN